jgi:SWI/SNF-related matrix-associated actin-dependent regulator of chromatin subfamily A member 5
MQDTDSILTQGLGKTLQTISLMGYLHEFRGITGPHMVVAPKSTLGNWMKEIARFCPILRAVKFLGNPEERVSVTCVFLNCYY